MGDSEPGLSQVLTRYPDGSAPRWLGQLGHVTALTYSYALPGGCDQLTATLQVPPAFRTDAMNPGRLCQVYRGGSLVWDGKLIEPVPAADGWAITAVGTGNAGTDFDAIWTTWSNQNDAVNQAIARGLRWVNPGIPGSVWLGQAVDSGSQTITDLLNLYTTKGNLTWYVGRGNILSVFAIPSVTSQSFNRILVAGSPVPRTLGGDVNQIYLRYQTSADSATTATYATTSVTEPRSVAMHGVMEAYADVSSAGQMTAGAAQYLGQALLNRYQRASFGGPFTVRHGELLTQGGYPVDLGCEQAATVCKVMLTDYGYGGEIVPDPLTFLVGAYAYDDMAQTASVTPFQSLNLSMSSLISMLSVTIPPPMGGTKQPLITRRTLQHGSRWRKAGW